MFVYAFSRTRSASVIGGKQPRAGIAERVASRNGKSILGQLMRQGCLPTMIV
jgi:hypothetical protein